MSILSVEKIKVHAPIKTKEEAIKLVGQMLVDAGHVPANYIDKMLEREQLVSTDLGGGLAMPHGTNEAKSLIVSTGISILTVPEGIDFGGDEPARLIIGLAAIGDDHMDVLTNVAMLVSDEEEFEKIITSADPNELLEIFNGGL
ncbi:MAG: PTS sugar transporter subunit IIA [Candidatus Pristimantibacillus lignocellulolyticus]|uniref:Mannitol-specific phosphotransferase enzyme IIA component n=1 Tax=Candidatus Pristimantibacillus lignocellulolyticus TaxID=2994561 RepID=A0A9J6ZG55_9BACL|nr:MAG: PTS sugar transporter subunit IIA [Candidatus Pristimantibacillus lignocellulolyticus]